MWLNGVQPHSLLLTALVGSKKISFYYVKLSLACGGLLQQLRCTSYSRCVTAHLAHRRRQQTLGNTVVVGQR